MSSKTDVFKLQQTASFRGIAFPISERECSHSHDTIDHKLQYRDKRYIDITGGSNLTFTYTIPFRQGLWSKDYKNAFTKIYPEFWLAYADTSVGPLIDPIRGIYQVRPGSWDEIAEVNRRDGIDVRITFTEAPELEDEQAEQAIKTVTGAYAAADALDREVEKQNWEQEPMPEPSIDPLSMIAGIGSQLAAVPDRVAARLHSVADKCDKIERSLERLRNPETTAQTTRAARRLRVSCMRLADEGANPSRTVKSLKLQANKSITAIAWDTGNSVEDLIKLNPKMAKQPFVLSSETIRFYG